MALTAQFLILLLIALATATTSATKFHFTVDDLYAKLNGRYCIRKLNETSAYGCASHYSGASGNLKVFLSGESLNASAKQSFSGEKIVAVIPAFMFSRNTVEVLNKSFDLRGILVLDKKAIGGPFSASPERRKTFSENAPNGFSGLEWNVDGDGLMHQDLKFPVYLLDKETSMNLLNQKRNTKITISAKLKSEMFAKDNSIDCIKKQKCLPVGGYSVWSVYPDTDLKNTKFIIITSRMSSSSMFEHNKIGATTSLAGLSIMLTVAKELDKVRAENQKTQKAKLSLMFVAFDKEEFAMSGSRLFAENFFEKICHKNQSQVFCQNFLKADLSMLDRIKKEQIVGVIDLNVFSKSDGLVVHLVKKNNYSDSLSVLLEKNALASSLPFTISKDAFSPPSPAWSFINFPDAFIVVLSDTKAEFKNPLYHSEFDDELSKIDLFKVSSVIVNSIQNLIWQDSAPSRKTDFVILEDIINCFAKYDCQGAFGNHPMDAKYSTGPYLAFSPTNPTVEAYLVSSILKSATAAKLGENIQNCAAPVCAVDMFDIDLKRNHWCDLGSQGARACYYSPTYLFPAYSLKVEYNAETEKWALAENPTYHYLAELFAVSLGAKEPAAMYLPADEKTSYVFLGAGVMLFAVVIFLNFALGWAIGPNYNKYKGK